MRIQNVLQAICAMAVGNAMHNPEIDREGHIDLSNGTGRRVGGTHSVAGSKRGPGGMCRSKHHGKVRSRKSTRR